MKKSIFITIFCGMLFSMTLPLMVVASEFNMQSFHQCKVILDKCPMLGPFRNSHCVKNKLAHHVACKQLAALSSATLVDANLINAEQHGNLTLVTLHYPADGKNLYSVLTSDNHLINLNQDPRKIDKVLAKKYQDHFIFTTALKKPIYKKWHSGYQEIIINVKLTVKCLACSVIGYATIFYHFDSKGKYVSAYVAQTPLNK